MIYLINVTYHNKKTDEIIDLLKIGYTGDSNRSGRFSQYRMHNPLFQILYEIPGASEEDEKRLQYHFREHQYGDYGNEWFTYDESIIDYFQSHPTKESLSDLPDLPKDKRSDLAKFRKEVREAVEYVLNVKVDHGDILLSDAPGQIDSLTDRIIEWRTRTTESLWGYIKSAFDILPPEYIEMDEDIREEVFRFISKFKRLSHFTDRMRLLCETDMTDKAKDIILNQIPIEFKTYYIALGESRIKANCYKKGELEKEYQKQVESSSGGVIENLILSNFSIGDRISISGAKQKLKDLYLSAGVTKSPKAIELLNYFEVKKTKVKADDGSKFVDGYEILSVKI